MRRYITAVLILALALPCSAGAQWYLFPGCRPAADSVAVTTASQDSVATAAMKETVSETVTDSTANVRPVFEDTRVTRVSLILPLKSTDTPNSNFLDFYCGALAAADALSSGEQRFKIDVYDSTLGLPSQWQLEDSELVIGPVGLEEMEIMVPRMNGKYLVSPLDPKVSALTDRFNVIQAPSGWESQADELVRWLGEDLHDGDQVVLLQGSEEADGELASRLAELLGDKGIAYVVSPSPASFEEGVNGCCRFVVASDNDEFCGAAVREIALMNLKGGDNAVYSTSRLRGAGDLEVESLHAAAAHITASYYADPEDPEVRRFAEKYRTLFKGDPGQWAFQGYDLMSYFGRLAAQNPGFWAEELAATPGQGLQTDFSFDAIGKNNTAVRRLQYNDNNTISVIK